jgi:hypothetical protein
MTALRAQLCVSVDESHRTAVDTATRWFSEGFVLLGGLFRDAALTLPPDELTTATRLSRAQPGGVGVMLAVANERPESVPYRPYSTEAWADLLRALDGVPSLAALECSANDNVGGSGGPFLDLTLRRIGGAGTWLILEVLGSPEMLGAGPQRSALLAFLRAAAEHANPVHGEVSWGKGLLPSVLEAALGTDPASTLPQGRRELRGYAWLTVIPEEIGARLGGVRGLRASGAFVEVERLGGGGYWCRAAARLEDYDQAAADRVFDAVAAALPPGEPNPWRVDAPNVLSCRAPASR